MAIVEIRPLDIPKWHGKKGEESFQQPHTIECLYDPMTGGYATGLTEGEEKKYSKKLGVDLSSVFNQDEPHPFWNSKMGRVKLENATMIFDDTRNLDFVKVKMLKASKYVANSIKDWKDGLYPEATHVIFDETQEEAIKATRALKKQEAIKLSLELSKEDQENIVQILTERTVRGRSSNYLIGEIDENDEEKYFVCNRNCVGRGGFGLAAYCFPPGQTGAARSGCPGRLRWVSHS